MKFGQQDRPKQSAPRKASRRAMGSLVAHRAFAPILGLWGTMLAGLTVMVLPSALIAQALRGTMIGASGLPVQLIAAAIAALLLGGGLFAIAAIASHRARRHAAEPSAAKRSVRPIDPVLDLGSSTFDDPIEATPFATPAWRDAKVADVEFEPLTVPRELELAEFAELPGRNAVWVEEVAEPVVQHAPETLPGAEPLAEPVADDPVTTLRQAAPLPDPGTAALARLRAQPTSELSMAEMVERFAGALHEHRTSPPARALTAADLAAREAALAEALKALAALSGESTSDAAKEPLRAALAQLQTPRKVGGGVG